MSAKSISFKYKIYDRSADGMLKEPPTSAQYYQYDDHLLKSFDSEEEAKQTILNLQGEDMWVANGLIIVLEAQVEYT